MIIIHLSDIHRSRAVLEKLGEISDKSDLLIVSGDVTTFGESSYFEEFMKKVSELNVKTFYVPGNNDKPDFSVPKGIENLDGRKIDYLGLSFGGLGGSPPTPFNTPYEVEEKELKKRLNRLGYVDVLISHSPPINTPSDKLDNGGHAGSSAIVEYIAEFKPKLVLCGHVHEAVSKFRLGDSLVINPGAAATRRYAKIKFEDGITATLSLF
jgi:Predicted phosphoesterases, related to the Icc protein